MFQGKRAPNILILAFDVPRKAFASLMQDPSFKFFFAADITSLNKIISEVGNDICGVIVEGERSLPSDIFQLPSLQAFFTLSTGQDVFFRTPNASVPAIYTTAGTVDDIVADHALALVFALSKRVGRLRIEDNKWQKPDRTPLAISGANFGILGLGAIGLKIAKRLAGFDARIRYHNRSQLEGVPYEYCDTLHELARQSDFLILSCSGGDESRHLVDAAVLERLGSRGFLVNVARGSVVETLALKRALADGSIAGAALDVLETEPDVDPELVGLENLILTPHIAWLAKDSVSKLIEKTHDNLTKHFAASSGEIRD